MVDPNKLMAATLTPCRHRPRHSPPGLMSEVLCCLADGVPVPHSHRSWNLRSLHGEREGKAQSRTGGSEGAPQAPVIEGGP